jgi:hypothetical protein
MPPVVKATQKCIATLVSLTLIPLCDDFSLTSNVYLIVFALKVGLMCAHPLPNVRRTQHA